MKTLKFAILGLALLMQLSVVSQATQTPPAKFKGIVVDANIARIPKASVIIESAEKRWELETDEDGKTIGEINFELPVGKYRFTVEAPGFKRLVVEDFCVASGATIGYEFRLEVRGCDDCDGLIAPDEPDPIPSARRPTKPCS